MGENWIDVYRIFVFKITKVIAKTDEIKKYAIPFSSCVQPATRSILRDILKSRHAIPHKLCPPPHRCTFDAQHSFLLAGSKSVLHQSGVETP
jgi:hypothetical protein